ncbi:hypothetical protein Nmel_009786 [Mimus melanotis]
MVGFYFLSFILYIISKSYAKLYTKAPSIRLQKRSILLF